MNAPAFGIPMTPEGTDHAHSFSVLPLLKCEPDAIQTYWQTLYMHDTLKHRLCDVKNPSWTDVLDMIRRMGKNMYCAVDENGEIIGEFMLENKTGDAWQIHFSIHPEAKYVHTIHVCQKVREQVLTWPGCSTLFGLTPITNRVACITVLKAGFKKVGILPSGIRTHEGVVDAMISVSTQGDKHGG